MAVPFIQNAFVSGEISPEMFGRTDVERFHTAASTMRNAFVSYRGGAYSRAGTAFVGYSKMTSSGGSYDFASPPMPRLIPFQFSINQGLMLEFGDHYMRVISNGAFVVENALNITGASNSDPCIISCTATGAETATSNNGGVAAPYAVGDSITLAGGVYSVPAQLLVVTTQLVGVQPLNPGSGYLPGDSITFSGGTSSTSAEGTVATTQVSAIASIVIAGTGGAVGNAIVTGTTGTGEKFQASVTVASAQTISPNNGSVTSSYASGDLITMAGGTFTQAEVLSVNTTQVAAINPIQTGSGYAPGDSITLAGGTSSVAAAVSVVTTQVAAVPSIVNAGSGGTAGQATITGTTGTGDKFQASVTIGSGGSIEAITALTVGGDYTVNPTDLSAEPVTGGGLTGATVSLEMGVASVRITSGGNFTVNPTGGTSSTKTLFLTSTGLSTWTVPVDWNSGDNSVELIGGGGGGGTWDQKGGGGGAYAKSTNLVLMPGASISYSVGAGGAGYIGASSTNATDGADTWFNGATFSAASVGAVGGTNGSVTSGSNAPGTGGSAASGIGTTKFSGGSATNSTNYTGGGGAGGPHGNGGSSGPSNLNYTGTGGGGGGGGTDSPSTGNGGANFAGTGAGLFGTSVSPAGGSGSNGGGGGGGFSNADANGGPGGAGGAGSEWTATDGATAGSGGGGGSAGGDTANPPFAGGSGGLYGGGGGSGGSESGTNGNGGNGAQGVIVITYVAASSNLTQAATSGAGTGATFLGVFAPNQLSVETPGSYSAFPPNPVSQASTTGSGAGATFNFINSVGISSIDGITVGGSYTVNPSNLAAEPVTGGGITGAVLSIEMGVGTISVTNEGVFTANPAGNQLSQESTSGAGTGATFQFCLFAPNTLSVQSPGVYSVFPSNPVAQLSSSGSGLGATFNLTSGDSQPYNTGDWVFIQGVGGMTELNGRTFSIDADEFSFGLFDAFGNAVDSTGYGEYGSGGTAARIYTLETPWSAEDLPWLKFTQSADVMSICCWNQETLTEYPPYDLTRLADNNWTLTPFSTQSSIGTPQNVSVFAQPNSQRGQGYQYLYLVTAVDAKTGEESLPSDWVTIGNFDLAFGGNVISWDQVGGAAYYNVYAQAPASNGTGGALNNEMATMYTGFLGLIGTSIATTFFDSGLTPDFSKGPPQQNDPFSPGQIIDVDIVSGGQGYTSGFALGPDTISYTINTSTGNGAKLFFSPQFPNSWVGAGQVLQGGSDYSSSDTITINGPGTGATATLNVGPSSGTYPGCVAYFQERRMYASSQNNPDTIWGSQNGLYLNFDTHFPVVDDDAITATPWSVAVDGVQWMVNMPGGLVVLTGQSAWQLTGTGGSSLNPEPLTPTSEQAQPQAYNGCSPVVPPIKIDYQILYVQAKGSIYREFTYQIFQNNYQGIDLTEISSHLFLGFTILEHTWCEEPYKTLWSVRDDGVMLSLTYVKPEQVQGWARHDTQGNFVSVASITEPPVDALYMIVERETPEGIAYMIERMDNRLWNSTEDAWCVDCGLSLGHTYPNAVLTASSSVGSGNLTGVKNLKGGKNYSSATYAIISDDNGNGPGSEAVANVSVAQGSAPAGTIIDVTFPDEGTLYVRPSIAFVDPAGSAGGSGGSAEIILQNTMTFEASSPVFSSESVGSIIRMGGGIAEITAYVSATEVTANILSPILEVIPNTGGKAAPAAAGDWSLDAPTQVIGGLWHLIGMEVTGTADGVVIPPQVVASDGTIALPSPATAAIIGLGYTVQIQSVYADGEPPTWQGRRKKIAAVTARLFQSGGCQVGSNQVDGSTLSPPQIEVDWVNMSEAPNKAQGAYNAVAQPLYSGDVRVPLNGGYGIPGQIAIQQTDPLPMNVLAFIPEFDLGDTPEASGGRS